MQCVILAGGLGTRMGDLTKCTPKALLEVGGKPFLYYQLRWLEKFGFTKATISIGHLGDAIVDYVQSKSWNLKVETILEGEKLLGTGGALRHALDLDKLDEKFVLLYGDSFLPIDFGEFWQRFTASPYPAVMTVFENLGRFDSSNAHFEGERVVFYSKRKPWKEPLRYIDYGLSGLSRDLIKENFRRGEVADLAGLFERLSVEGRLGGIEIRERFYEIGSLQGLEDFRRLAAQTLTAL